MRPQTVQRTRTTSEAEIRKSTLYFAHSARGAGWRTDLVLLNPNSDMVYSIDAQVFGTGPFGSKVKRLTLEKDSSIEWELPTPTEGVDSGGVVVSSSAKIAGYLRFRHTSGAAFSVQASPMANGFMVPVSNEVDRVGVAVFNPSNTDLTVTLGIGAATA